MSKYYFTFCQRLPTKDCFVVFEGNYVEARSQMVKNFGDKWAFQYSEEGWFENGVSQETKYHLTRLEV